MDASTIFAQALDQPDRTALSKFLDEACGENSALRTEVEALLQAHQDAGDFLQPIDDPALIPTYMGHQLTEKAGDQIGPYKLLQKIGEGGFGVVYMAEQTDPVRRKVALKVIKPGMDTKEVIARFEAERQALALMDHPNIAKVLDGGMTETGRPYFVMELVKGIPITKFCDENKLDTQKRLRLFVSVCRAIQHAHHKGVIHRDIKPNNVLVTLHDGEPVPKVIDFGVAKAISQQLTEKTMFTAFGQMIGTPQYMSPEQAEMSGLDVDTRSDIFSLGVLLYELLTGTTPLDPKRLRETAYHELQRIIREEEPPKPSTRLTSLHEQSALIATNRGTVPDKLGALVRGDLDWIVMQSLDKNRERRYDTANALADDIQRFLSSEPVEACPPSLTYRFRKYVKRNKGLIATSSAIAAALIVGLSVATWQAVRATAALKQSVAAEKKANELALKFETEAKRASVAEARATIEAELALENEQAVSSVIDFLVKELISKANPYVEQNRDLTVNELLKLIAQNPDTEYPGQPQAEASVRHYLGVICHRIGLTDESQKHLRNALELRLQHLGPKHVDTARTQFALAYALLDFRLRYQSDELNEARNAEIINLVRRAVPTLEKELGKTDLETLHAIAFQAFVTGYNLRDPKGAEVLHQEILARAPQGLPPNLDDPLDLLGSLYLLMHLDEVGTEKSVDEEIKQRYEQALERLPRNHPQLAFWTEWYGTSLFLLGHVAESEPYLTEGYRIRSEVLEEDNFFRFLATRSMAQLRVRQGRIDEGIEFLEEALKQVPEHAGQSLNLSSLYLTRKDEGDRNKWLAIAQSMLDEYADTNIHMSVNNTVEICLAVPAETNDEREMQERAIRLSKEFRKHDGESIDDPTRQAVWVQRRRYTIALAHFRDGDFVKAKERFQEVLKGDFWIGRALGFVALATIAAQEGNLEQAEAMLKKSSEAREEVKDHELYIHQGFAWNRQFQWDLLTEEAESAIEATKSNRSPSSEGQSHPESIGAGQ